MLTLDFFTTLASLLKGGPDSTTGLFVAVGTGEAAWDETPPDYDRSVKALSGEAARKAVVPAEIVFLDADGEATETPSPCLRFQVAFDLEEAVGTLRECGLFGGEASEQAGSGTLLAYYTHPRLEKTAVMTLSRHLTIDLTPQPYTPGTRATRYLGNSRSRECHDLENSTPRCQVDEIRPDNRFYLANLEQAADMGYDFCAYCFGAEMSER
ncbi:MAG: hypothetical protein GY803_30115 [Chloroflexi bacterium]|nr:hypothetical protein [Chloroflexota bacterium]